MLRAMPSRSRAMRTPFLVAALAACVCLGRPLPAVAEAEVPRVRIAHDCASVPRHIVREAHLPPMQDANPR